MNAWNGGVQLGYDDAGSGDAIVFVHGFPHRRTLWAPQMDALMGRARCVALDLRGFGDSPAEPPYSVEQYADDVLALCDTLRLGRVVLCGLSMGGYVAFAFWRRHPERVRGLVLMDTKAGADNDVARGKRKDMMALAEEKGSEAIADAMITGMVGKSTREKCPEVVDAVHRMLVSAPVPGIVGALEAMMNRPDSTPTLATISVPTLIMVGEEDTLTPVAESRAMHEAIRDSRLEIIANAGHVSNLERPAAVNHVLSEFLASINLA
jgi:pimeloyl-ACP methyl ester carboxylesterase